MVPLLLVMAPPMVLAMDSLIREIGTSPLVRLVLRGCPLSAVAILTVALSMSTRFSDEAFAAVTLAVALRAAAALLTSLATIAVRVVYLVVLHLPSSIVSV